MANRFELDAVTVENVEQTLVRMLRPVQPDPGFVDQLHRRLVTPPTFTLARNSKAVGLVILAGGLLSGLAALVVARHIYRLISGKRPG
jgi:hypothetical protein